MTRFLPLMLVLAGCAASLRGTIAQDGEHTLLEEVDGTASRLRLKKSARLLAYLDGELVEVEGTRSFGAVGVDTWRVIEGVSGLPAYVGRLDRRGNEIAVFDHYAQTWFLLESDVLQEMTPFVGLPVLVEGYLGANQRIRVVHYQVLSEDEH